MFAAAYGYVRDYARPVLLSGTASDSRCGSFVIINRSGWVITAKHILEEAETEDGFKKSMWGWKGVSIDEVFMDSDSDLAVGRLTGFDGDWVSDYPVFCEPEEIVLGMSVGRIGYTIDDGEDIASASAFMNSGIVSKDYEDSNVRCIVTSSPGIKGQSGGPVFDKDGAVCGLQVSTRIAGLGYHRMSEHGEAAAMVSCEGLAVHVEAVRKFLDTAGVSYRIKG